MTGPDRPIRNLPGLGPVSVARLERAGIETESALRALGAAAAWRRVKHMEPAGVSLNLLWGLHEALTGTKWNCIDPETKARLKAEAGV